MLGQTSQTLLFLPIGIRNSIDAVAPKHDACEHEKQRLHAAHEREMRRLNDAQHERDKGGLRQY